MDWEEFYFNIFGYDFLSGDFELATSPIVLSLISWGYKYDGIVPLCMTVELWILGNFRTAGLLRFMLDDKAESAVLKFLDLLEKLAWESPAKSLAVE